ncbi:hypothetical protein EV182_007447, partial [Spiromyces aspiralis]
MDSVKSPGKTFKHRMLKTIQTRIQAILVDPVLNDDQTVLSNVYQALMYSAMKYHQWSAGLPYSRNDEYLFEVIQQCVRYACALVRVYRGQTGEDAKEEGAGIVNSRVVA